MGYLTGSEGQYFYTGGQRGVVRIWDTTTKKEIAQSPGSYTEGKETGGILDIMYLKAASVETDWQDIIGTRRLC